jgi:hypothetical protein
MLSMIANSLFCPFRLPLCFFAHICMNTMMELGITFPSPLLCNGALVKCSTVKVVVVCVCVSVS